MSDTTKLLLLWVVAPTIFMLVEGTYDYRKKRMKYLKNQQKYLKDQQWR